MTLFPRRHRRKAERTPVVPKGDARKAAAKKKKNKTSSVQDMDVSREDRGYDPYDTSPREKISRGKVDKWSF